MPAQIVDLRIDRSSPVPLYHQLAEQLTAAIADGRRPAGMSEDEEIVYEFATELVRTKQVSNRTFERAKTRFGTKGIVDLTGITGYYTLLAMQLNAAQYQMPKDGKKLPRLPG